MMTRSMAVLCFAVLSSECGTFAADRAVVQPRMKKEQVLAVAKAAIKARYPDLLVRYPSYDAMSQNGVWLVFAAGQRGIRGGGSPEAEIRDRDGKVLRLYLSR